MLLGAASQQTPAPLSGKKRQREEENTPPASKRTRRAASPAEELGKVRTFLPTPAA
jgi:hypothetical protein